MGRGIRNPLKFDDVGIYKMGIGVEIFVVLCRGNANSRNTRKPVVPDISLKWLIILGNYHKRRV